MIQYAFKTNANWAFIYGLRLLYVIISKLTPTFLSKVHVLFLGYGDIVPETDGGKRFVIIYAMIGIPVNLILIATMGYMLSDFAIRSIQGLEKNVFKVKEIRWIEHKTLFALTTLCIFWLLVGAGIGRRVMGWTWTESLYAAFIRFTTIGYGDYSLDHDKIKNVGELIAWYTIGGLTICTGIFDIIGKIFDKASGGVGNAKVANDDQDCIEMNAAAT